MLPCGTRNRSPRKGSRLRNTLAGQQSQHQEHHELRHPGKALKELQDIPPVLQSIRFRLELPLRDREQNIIKDCVDMSAVRPFNRRVTIRGHSVKESLHRPEIVIGDSIVPG